MMDLRLENILLDIFQEDINNNKAQTYITQITILTIKSLIPSVNEIGNRIDYRRFYEELKLWKYYSLGENNSLLNILGDIDEDVYFSLNDSTLYSRIIPIILANEKHDIIEDEIIKNIIYSTGNIQNLLEWVTIGRLLYLVIEKEEDIIEKLKEYLINISQVDFLDRYERLYKVNINKYPGNYKIIFERERLNLLNLLNGISINEYTILKDIMDVLEGDSPMTEFGKIIYNSTENGKNDYRLNEFYFDMNDYIFKLIKSRINPNDLVINEYILPDVFSFNEGEMFFHSLFKNCKVIKKEVRNGTLTSLIGTRTGMYLFKKNPI